MPSRDDSAITIAALTLFMLRPPGFHLAAQRGDAPGQPRPVFRQRLQRLFGLLAQACLFFGVFRKLLVGLPVLLDIYKRTPGPPSLQREPRQQYQRGGDENPARPFQHSLQTHAGQAAPRTNAPRTALASGAGG